MNRGYQSFVRNEGPTATRIADSVCKWWRSNNSDPATDRNST